MLHDVVAAVGGVFAHVEGEGLGDGGQRTDPDFDQPHVAVDKLSKLLGGNLAKALEAGDFRGPLELLFGALALALVVAVVGFLFVADPEERRFEDIDMARGD